MKIRYLVKSRFKKGVPDPIYVALYLNDQVELIYTKERIARKHWSFEDGQPKDHTGDVATRIEKVRVAVQKTIKLLEAQDKPVTPFTVKQAYLNNQRDKALEQLEKDRNDKLGLESVSSLVSKWLQNNLFGYRPSTQKTVRQSIGQFQLFLKTAGLTNLERQRLNSGVITDFERFLQEKKRLSNSTHGRTMKHLRWFLKTLNYDIRSIPIRTHRKDIIALTIEELEQLEAVDVSFSKKLQKAKDMFLLGCYLGLRISDLKRLNSTRIIEGQIRMTLQKNRKKVSIPVRSETRKILQVYGMESPKISEQHLNKDIKKVCKLAKINKILTVKTNKAGLDVEKQRPKYELITSHTSSKTFITLAPKKYGMEPAEIAAIVGKDLKTLINFYYQLPLESAIKKMTETETDSKMALSR